MRFYLDTCISINLARALRELEAAQGANTEVIIHAEVVAPAAPDPAWLPILRGLRIDVLLTSDGRIRKSPDERKAWAEAGVLTYFMSNRYCGASIWPQVEEMMHWWPHVKRHARNAAPGSAWSLAWQEKEPRLLEHHDGSRPEKLSKRDVKKTTKKRHRK